MSWWLRVLVWAPVCSLLALEVILSSCSSLPEVPGLTFAHADKLIHGGYFFMCGLATVHAAHFWEGWPRRRTFLLILFGTLLYGLCDEFHQSFVPHRTAETLDVLADVTGAGLAAGLGPLFLRWMGLARLTARVLPATETAGGRDIKISSESYDTGI